ncbi:MAG: transketolase, partial [Opitutales bacterium]
MSLNNSADLSRAATEARGLAMDAVAACHSGHLGLPLGAAEIGSVLYGNFLRHDPAAPSWINRDRFVLSAGHGSMFVYAWVHLAGFDLPLQEVKNFRKLHSKTPGHPEFGETVGVEATTGPLGQGTGNIVGMAVAAKMAAAHFNTAEHKIFDHVVVGLAGDGCLQEGISQEAASFAGRFGLDNLIMLYDSNDVTLDAMASKTQNEDTAKRYEAANWEVFTVKEGNQLAPIAEALDKARASKNGKPKLIICKTVIGKGIAEVQGTS